MKVNIVSKFNFLVFFLLSICFLSGCKKGTEYDLIVEGIHYIDKVPVSIKIKDGKIQEIKKIKILSDKKNSFIVAPGLIDNQINGYMGHSFVNTGKELSIDGIKSLTSALWKVGVTTFLPTLTTNDHNIFLQNFKLLAKAKEDIATRGSIVGFHLEGPYISPVDGYRGAHPLKYVRQPDWNEFLELYEASKKNILQVSLAPEMEGAEDFIKKCATMDIKVGLAHHNASPSQITKAIDNGAIIATHLGNGLANSINRWNNPLWTQLADDRMLISIICDGFHLTPEQIKTFYKTKGAEKIIMTSDMSVFGGLEPGFYLNAIGDTLELKAEGVVIYPAQNSLSGSASPLSKMVGYVMQVTGCSLADAIQMASTNPAHLYNLNDRGELEPGMRADLILFTLDENVLDLKQTIVNGKIVYEVSK